MARALTSEAIAAGLELLRVRPLLAVAWHVYPTDVGGMLFELVRSGRNCSVEIVPAGGLEIYGDRPNGTDGPDTVPAIDGNALSFLDRLIGEAP
jgi:hypothetical protein